MTDPQEVSIGCPHPEAIRVRGVFGFAEPPRGAVPGWYPDPCGPFDFCPECKAFSVAGSRWIAGPTDAACPHEYMKLVFGRILCWVFSG